MNDTLLKSLKDLLPPVVVRQLNRIYGWKFNYHTWADAQLKSTSYDVPEIVDKVRESVLKVINGEAAYEKDSVLFYKNDYSYPLVSCLLLIAGKNNNRLNVIDFGGSLASTYFRNRIFIQHLSPLRWNIIEQQIIFDCGKKDFTSEIVRFYDSLDGCLIENDPDVIILSGVIQYMEHPYQLLSEIVAKGINYILFDRTPFVQGDGDYVTLQKVPPFVYHASYPCWIFNENKMSEFLSREYVQVCDFDSIDDDDYRNIYFKGFLFKRKSL